MRAPLSLVGGETAVRLCTGPGCQVCWVLCVLASGADTGTCLGPTDRCVALSLARKNCNLHQCPHWRANSGGPLPFSMQSRGRPHCLSTNCFRVISPSCELLGRARASLLREKCLPPLIRIRQRLRDRPGPTTSTTPALKKYTPRHPPPRPDDRSSDLGNGRRDKVGAEGQPVVRGREVTGDENDGRGSVGAAGGGDAQPRLEAMVGLIIDEMVGKSSSVR